MHEMEPRKMRACVRKVLVLGMSLRAMMISFLESREEKEKKK